MNRAVIGLLVLTAGFAAAPAQAAALPRYGVFVYRSFCFEAGSGDTGGVGLTVIRSIEGDTALYQYAEGAIEWPLLAYELKIDDAGRLTARFGSVEKDVQADVRMQAALSPDLAVVTTGEGDLKQVAKVPRVTDLGAKPAACKAR